MRRISPLALLVAITIMVVSETRTNASALYVTNFSSNRVNSFDSSGNSSTPITGISGPIGDAFGPDGNLYVVSSGGNATPAGVYEYTPSGTLIQSFTSTLLPNPTGIAFDKAGNFYVSNISNDPDFPNIPDSIVEFQKGTGTASTFTSTHLNAPFGLAFDTLGNLYVANASTVHVGGEDPYIDTVTKYSPGGAFLGTFGDQYGVGNITGNAPTGLAFDAAGNLYVSNFGPDTITKLDAAGNTVQTLTVPTGGGPAGLAFDSSGNLFVALENATNSILEFASTGVGSVSSTSTVFATEARGSSPYFLAFAPTAVPEPASLLSLMVGLVGSAGYGIAYRRRILKDRV